MESDHYGTRWWFGSRSGGMLGASNTSVLGTFAVRSCCGFGTNDIRFSIYNAPGFTASRNYGVIVDSFSFEWNTGRETEYQLIFDNGRGQVCDPQGVCLPDPSHPSRHNKTIEVRVTEQAQATLGSLFESPSFLVLTVASVIVVAGVVLSVAVILRERRRRTRQP